jgi:GDSL-like lipase/acylhydrolase family protein
LHSDRSSIRHGIKKKAVFWVLALALSGGAAVFFGEASLRLFFPQETLFPRWGFSARYCSLPFRGTRMVHERAGRWRFVYSINSLSCRGSELPIDRHYGLPNIVVLGDSYTFGAGVNDGDEYPAVMERKLAGKAKVINLGVGGWGLTQEIRRYYELGTLYQPVTVVLQFSANDLIDDLKCPVTEVVGDRFVFHDTHEPLFRLKNILSRSMLQKSQIYNLFRDSVYRLFEARIVKKNRIQQHGSSSDEAIYVGLLERFVKDLGSSGVRVVFITVNDQLREFPMVHGAVNRLAAGGLLEFHDAVEWLEREASEPSPEGHLWGRRAHGVIGEKLAGILSRPWVRSSPLPGDREVRP